MKNEFRKFQHVERMGRLGSGILDGVCYVFPKLDGTNASMWYNIEFGIPRISCGSRRRELSPIKDNHGFCSWATSKEKEIVKFFEGNNLEGCTLYGEWLVPHTLKTYRDDAWRRFYLFDIKDRNGGYISYNCYKDFSFPDCIDVIHPLAIMYNPDIVSIKKLMMVNGYLMAGTNIGEGVVVKNYEYRYHGRQQWGKIIYDEFAEQAKQNVKPKNDLTIEERIVNRYVTTHFIEKEFAKLQEGWTSKKIPMLLNTVYYELINEETWNFVKQYKLPTINFRALQRLVNQKIRVVKSELFTGEKS